MKPTIYTPAAREISSAPITMRMGKGRGRLAQFPQAGADAALATTTYEESP
jgi:hypothetical protein